MKNYNLFSVLGVILVLAFVFTGSAIADPDGGKKQDEEKSEGKHSKPPNTNAPAKPAALSRVQISQLQPSRSSAGTVVFTWTTKSEMENAGFNILRSETRNGPFKPINSALIHGAGTTKKKQTYHWTDVSAKPNVVYYYQLETISFAGTRQQLTAVRLHGHVSASGKLATRWAMLKARR